MEKKRGDQLQKDDVLKTNGRVYQVVDLAPDTDHLGGYIYGTFRTTSLELVDFYVFDDSEYEMRDALKVRNQPRMIKVRAEDVWIAVKRAERTKPADQYEVDAIADSRRQRAKRSCYRPNRPNRINQEER